MKSFCVCFLNEVHERCYKKTLPAIAYLTDDKLAMTIEESADGVPKKEKKAYSEKLIFSLTCPSSNLALQKQT